MEEFWILIAFLVLGIVVLLLLAGGIAFGLVLRLQRRVQALEARLGASIAGGAGAVAGSTSAGAGPSAPRAQDAKAGATAAPAIHEAPPAPTGTPRDASTGAPSPAAMRPIPTRPRARSLGESREKSGTTSARTVAWDRLESRLGTQWLNWIGAIVSFLGIAFLLKLLYDQGLIGPAGRVGVGLTAGLGFLFFAELRVRRNHDLLAQAISALGVGTLFLTTFLAFKFYGFSGQLATFGLMAWFATFAVALAVLREGRVLATLGVLLAYAVPSLLSTGQDQAEALFAYLALLALAGAAVRIARDWREITTLGLVLTAVYYGGWHERFYETDRLPIAVTGAVGMAVIFAVSAVARGLVRGRAVGLIDSLSLTFAQIFALYHLSITLGEEHGEALGFAMTGLAFFDLVLLRSLRARAAPSGPVEDGLLLLSTGLLLLVIPAVLRAEGALVAWSLGAVLLADAASRSHRRSIGVAAVVAVLAALLTGLSQDVRHRGVFHFLGNGVFLAWLAVAVACFLSGGRFVARTPTTPLWSRTGRALQILAGTLLLALLSYEISAWFRGRIRLPGADVAGLLEWRRSSLLVLWALFPAIYLWRARRFPALWLHAAAHHALLGLGFCGLLVASRPREVWIGLNPVFLAALLFPAATFVVARGLRARFPRVHTAVQLYAHGLTAILIACEIHGVLGSWPWTERVRWISTAMVSVAWAVQACIVLGLGMRNNRSSWRWFALALLAVTLVKVLIVDMSQVRQIWRVVSFAVLGVLLMGCSLVYARHEKRKRSGGGQDDAN